MANPPDFSLTASDYHRFRRAFPDELFRRLRNFNIGTSPQTILDVGAGTGLLSDALRHRGCNVISMDISHALLSAGLHESRIVARSEQIPFPDAAFDAVTAAQCWHWFDRMRAPAEILRVLKPDGPLAVVYQMYVPVPGTVAASTEALILRHHPRWRHANSAGINGQVLRDVQASGFVEIESFSFDIIESFTHEQWRGFIRTTSAVGASLSAEQVLAFDMQHAELLKTSWPEPSLIPHRIFAAVARKPVSRL